MSCQARRTRLEVWAFALILTALTATAGAEGIMKWSDVPVDTKIPKSPEAIQLGKKIFKHACLNCHGANGEGDGVAERYLYTKPRDFTSGTFKVRTTSSGSPPTDEDLYRSITVGFPEFHMPRFEYMSPKERWSLVHYIKKFDSTSDGWKYQFPKSVGTPLPSSRKLLELGEQLYEDAECWRCHGRQGRGDGPSAPTLVDDSGHPSRVAAFALGARAFKRGATPRDIVDTFMTGLSGTPMPSYEEAFTNEQAWAVAHYVESLTKSR